MNVNKDEGNMEKQQKMLYWNGRILSKFLPSPFVKKIVFIFFGESDPLKQNLNSSKKMADGRIGDISKLKVAALWKIKLKYFKRGLL